MARPIDFTHIDEHELEKLGDNFSRLLELGNLEQRSAARSGLMALDDERKARRARNLARRALAAGFA
jgi:hypothetical protein